MAVLLLLLLSLFERVRGDQSTRIFLRQVATGESLGSDGDDLHSEHFRQLVEYSWSNASSPAPPAPPPMPPLAPAPVGFAAVATTDTLRAAIAAAPDGAQLALYLPPGSVFRLGGRPIAIHSIELVLASDAEGATLDAEHVSRVFDARPGATLRLRGLTLANGRCTGTSDRGGTMDLHGVHMELDSCVITNSSSSYRGGAVSIDNTSVAVINRSVITNSAAATDGGAFCVDGVSRLHVNSGCTFRNCTAERGGVFGLFSEGRLEAFDTRFTGNHAKFVGAVFAMTDASYATFISCWMVNQTSDYTGGVGGLQKTSTVLMVDCTAANQWASSFAGILVVLENSRGTLMNCSFTNTTSQHFGGCFAVLNSASLSIAGGSYVMASAANGGGFVYMFSPEASLLLTNGTLCQNIAVANGRGGIAQINSGQVVIDNGCRFINNRAAEGAVFACSGGSITVVDCFFHGNEASSGGGVLVTSGVGSIGFYGCTLVDSTSAAVAGVAFVDAGLLVFVNCEITGCYSSGNGAFCNALKGRMELTNVSIASLSSSYSVSNHVELDGAFSLSNMDFEGHNVFLSDSKAQGGGGNIAALEGSRVVFTESRFQRLFERVIRIAGGEVHLVRCTVERSESAPLLDTDSLIDGTIMHAVDGVQGVMLVTNVTFRQHACDSAFFRFPTTVDVVLRGHVTFERLDECTEGALAESLSANSPPFKGCGDTYTDREANVWGVCASQSVGACSAQLLPNTSISNIDCKCPPPEYLNTDVADADFAPFGGSFLASPDGGCIVPMGFRDAVVVSRSINVALEKDQRKPMYLQRSLNISMTVAGTDVKNPANWSLLNPTSLASWLSLPVLGGQIDAQPLFDAYPVGVELQIPLTLNARGLREQAVPYVETLLIDVRSAVEGNVHTEPMAVTLSVQVRTSSASWGRVSWNDQVRQMCNPSLGDTTMDGTATVGETVPWLFFTACDDDLIPVGHQLPTLAEPERRFSLSLMDAGSGMPKGKVDVSYAGEGVYNLELTLDSLVRFGVALRLDGKEVAGRLIGAAECSLTGQSYADACSCKPRQTFRVSCGRDDPVLAGVEVG